MSEIKLTNYHDIVFNRDTKVDYKNGDVVVNTIFGLYDTDRSGSFNDIEWESYRSAQAVKDARKAFLEDVKNGVVTHYQKKIDSIIKNLEKTVHKYEKLDISVLDELDKFEQNHTMLYREAVTDKSKIPTGSVTFDSEVWGIGVYDEKTGNFTGEIAKYGYIVGLETLSKEERKEYLSLLRKSERILKENGNLSKKIGELEKELDRYMSLEDMANCGLLTKVGSKEQEDEAYNQYTQIRSEANPFYKKIRELELESQKIRLKGSPTEEDLILLEQYGFQIYQLKHASEQWSIAEVSTRPITEEKNKINVQFTPAQATYTQENLLEEVNRKELSNQTSMGINYSGSNLNISGNVSATQKYIIAPTEESRFVSDLSEVEFEKGFEFSGNANLEIGYKRENLGISSNSNLDVQETMLSYNQHLEVSYDSFGLAVDENVYHSYGEFGGTTNSTDIKLNHRIKSLNNSAFAHFEAGNSTYGLSSNYFYNKKLTNNLTLDISPALSATYNTGVKSTTLNPQLNTGVKYTSDKLTFNALASESFIATMSNKNSSYINNDLTLSGNVEYKGLDAGVSYNNMSDNYSSTNTYGVNFGYRFKKAGAIKLQASIQSMLEKMSELKTNTGKLTFSYLLNF